MQVINLTDPLKSVIPFSIFKFPGGEQHITINIPSYEDYIGEDSSILIKTRLNTSDDIMLLLLATDAVKRLGYADITLHIPYVPYARQDRVANPGEPLSARVFSNLINLQEYTNVIVYDAHSDVVTATINNCINKSNAPFIKWVIEDIRSESSKVLKIVSPDAGAQKKIHNKNIVAAIKEANNGQCELILASKYRDIETGQIKETHIDSEDLLSAPCLIIDDICDGGRTFTELAKVLKSKNAGDLYLAVSHGIFSNGFGELKKYFKRVYCTNSISDIPDEYFDGYSNKSHNNFIKQLFYI